MARVYASIRSSRRAYLKRFGRRFFGKIYLHLPAISQPSSSVNQKGIQLTRRSFALILVLGVLLAAYMSRGLPSTPLSNVSAVEIEANIEVYWDQSCSRPVSSIEWGNCTPGQAKDTSVYVRNAGSEEFVLVVTSVDWSPVGASDYISLSRVGEGIKIQPGEAARITVRLSVSSEVTGISSFSFKIIFEGRKYFLTDLNLDGKVDIFDAIVACEAYESISGEPRWNPKADINRDGTVNIFDIILIIMDFGKIS